jgi:hypothetical protein
MWILRYCKDILDHFNSRSLSTISPVQTSDFSTPYKPLLVKIYKHVEKYHLQRIYLYNGKQLISFKPTVLLFVTN